MHPSPWRSALGVCGRLAVLAALLTVLGGGSCAFCSGSCDDDDDDKGDGKGPAPAASSPPAADISFQLARWLAQPGRDHAFGSDLPDVPPADYVLRDFGVELTDVPGRHPVWRVTDIQGLSVFDSWGLAVYDARQLAAFATRVLEANASLLGLPPGAGELRAERTEFLDTIVVVSFEQRFPWLAATDAGEPGAALVVFDLQGRLLLIENNAELPSGTVFPLPDSLR